MYKNREELLKELEDVKADRDDALDALASAVEAKKRIVELNDELEEYKKREDMKAEFDKAASQIKILNDSFVEAGFTNEQAFTLITVIIPAMLNPAQAPSIDRLLGELL